MLLIHLPQADIEAIQDVLASFPSVKLAKVFGSRAKGTHQKGSDVDIAIELQPFSNDELIQICQVLEEQTLLPYFFDVVDVNHLSNKELKDHIARVGQIIYPRV